MEAGATTAGIDCASMVRRRLDASEETAAAGEVAQKRRGAKENRRGSSAGMGGIAKGIRPLRVADTAGFIPCFYCFFYYARNGVKIWPKLEIFSSVSAQSLTILKRQCEKLR